MARQARNNVDYFPHSVNHGKKMFYLRTKYGNDGYAVWFMILEELGKAEFHYLDLKDEVALMYLSCEFKVTEETLKDMINVLVKFGEFDSDLWQNEMILFNEKFVENIADAYKKRNNNCIDKNSLLQLLTDKGRIKKLKSRKKPSKSNLKGGDNTQSKEKNSKGDNSKEEEITHFPDDFLLNEKYIEFLKFRKEIKKTVAKASIDANKKKLMKLAGNRSDTAIEIIEQSIANGWQGFFNLKNDNNGGKQQPTKIGSIKIPDNYNPDVY